MLAAYGEQKCMVAKGAGRPQCRPWRIMLQNRPIMLCGNSLEIALLCLGLVLFCSHGSFLCSHYAHAYYTIDIITRFRV